MEGSIVKRATWWHHFASAHILWDVNTRDQCLSQYEARWISEFSESYVEFETEQEATAFLLRWS